ncbi:MAG: hypothetical protein A2W93_05730 [Bacteroidetes bacterium GWF2_43_63]|nr:MAG: hypothetical protein A2W94_07335 [Bacteroidetes bacterium GWE2_42_42]OFY55514.1 MAG: hypothetical protein A2W93_05730 [Bacteroidetes bacterium GWF2_43_63]HBG69994.1 hypothetical protein [Bacteroidales bacterium]HCB62581.1 hypothetical protein [Bacteroidales bacterium]HCY23701.1 hypothetical protein [Bacteroidales bacterium]
MKSIFSDKLIVPTEADLKTALGATFVQWQSIVEYAHDTYPKATDEWKFPGEKHGWSFRVSDKKRVLVYLLPRDGFFKVAMVFGQKAFEAVMNSTVSEDIKHELSAAKAYAEGRGIQIDVRDKSVLNDIQMLIDIKLGL